MFRKITLLLLFASLLVPFSTAHAVILIDLNDFWADPSVIVASDGSSATMYEDPGFITVLLSNDPGMGDPGIAVPLVGLISMNFDYDFEEGPGNDDNFYAWVFDPTTYTMIDEFWIEDSGSGTVSWDLSGLDPVITLLGMEFQLNSYDFAFDSFVEISNVNMVPVPEPCTMILFGSGLAGLFGIGRKKFLKFV